MLPSSQLLEQGFGQYGPKMDRIFFSTSSNFQFRWGWIWFVKSLLKIVSGIVDLHIRPDDLIIMFGFLPVFETQTQNGPAKFYISEELKKWTIKHSIPTLCWSWFGRGFFFARSPSWRLPINPGLRQALRCIVLCILLVRLTPSRPGFNQFRLFVLMC